MYRCLSTLKEITHEGYSNPAIRQLAGGNRRFPYRLSFERHAVVEFSLRSAQHMSISGVQEKISLRLHRGKLEATGRGGEYILKPVPSADIPVHKSDIPANENLTMQIASQVFGINTAANACIMFSKGELAYITKRFDRRGGIRVAQEDFCQLSNRSEETAGRNYKYDGTYEEAGRILRRYCGAYAIEIEKLFARIVFNYAFSNGDAHLKNFSLFDSGQGDYILTPAYDLLCTSLHFPSEARTALDLFDSYESDSFRQNGFYTGYDFMKLAEIYGINADRAGKCIDAYVRNREKVYDMISRSFMSAAAKADYRRRYDDRLLALAAG